LESAFGIIEIGPAESIEVANDRFEATILVLSQTGLGRLLPVGGPPAPIVSDRLESASRDGQLSGVPF
jgi:hypothetical protein